MRREDVAGASGMKRSAGLGRGLSALLGEMEAIATAQSTGQGVEAIAISAIIPNQRQPRGKFVPTKLVDLPDSIQAQGPPPTTLVRPLNRSTHGIVPRERPRRAAPDSVAP